MVDVQRRIRDDAEDRRECLVEIGKWEEEIGKTDAALSSTPLAASYPPIRGSDAHRQATGAEEAALREKDLGNTAFRNGKYEMAIRHYTTSLDNVANPVVYSNRAQAALKLDRFAPAERDATTAIRLTNPSLKEEPNKDNVKAYWRRAQARKSLGQTDDAEADLRCILTVDPFHADAKRALVALRPDATTPVPTPPPPAPKASPAEPKVRRLVIEDDDEEEEETPAAVRPDTDSPVKTTTPPASSEPVTPVPTSTRLVIAEDDDEDDDDDATPVPANQVAAVSPESTNGADNGHEPHSDVLKQQQRPLVEVVEDEPQKSATPARSMTAPKTHYEFAQGWGDLEGSDDKLLQYIQLIDPTQLRVLIKSQLTGQMLDDLIRLTYVWVQRATTPDSAFAALRVLFHLATVTRFTELSAFLDDDVVNTLKRIFELAAQRGAAADKIEKVRKRYADIL